MKKEVFDGLDNDLFVYEVYLEVLTAQAQFEVIFNRPWGSKKHVAHGDLTNYLFIPINTVENLRNYLRRRAESQTSSKYSKTDSRSCTSGTNKRHAWVKDLLQRIEQKHTGLVFPKYDDYYMEKVIFEDLFVDDWYKEDREVSEFARNELEFNYHGGVCKQTETGLTDLLWTPPKTIEKIRDYLKREEENQTSSLF